MNEITILVNLSLTGRESCLWLPDVLWVSSLSELSVCNKIEP